MGGQEYDSDDSNSDRGGIPIEGVIFLLDDLLYQFDAQDYFDDDETELNYPYRVESIAATYVSPVEEILSSRLNIAGFVRAIYVNFGPMGYYELDPNARGITEPTVFEAQLSDLFKTGKITNPDNGQVIWRMITNFSSILSSLPANNQILEIMTVPESARTTETTSEMLLMNKLVCLWLVKLALRLRTILMILWEFLVLI
ncbi:uncharacterized protein LOC109807195 isoform X2 [Cajanus cajan]|uniref:uncharacterized protein LOC109807195 isoform X2 n=1 Tax=Cajanus cajan TaxID=3821 RepID=UPI0010FB0DC1|nr:uncharacterized protein LOC109807195 isoform X2 [Cajanus cajan]